MYLGEPILAQDLVINTSTTLFNIDLNSCETTQLSSVNREYFDISFHPNGKLYGVGGGGAVFEINSATGAAIPVFSFVPAFYNSLTIDDDGTFYAYDFGGAVWTYKLGDPAPNLLGVTRFTPSGDLTFFREELYAAVSGNRIVRINLNDPQSSVVVVDENISGQLTGIVLLAETCEDVTMYAITAETPESTGQAAVYRIDVDNGFYEKVCNLAINAFGGASTLEFLGSSVPIEVTGVTTSYPNCEAQGTIELTVAGGAGNFTFQHFDEPPQASSTFRNLLLGTHEITIRDEKGCFVIREIDLTGAVDLIIDSTIIFYPGCQPGEANLKLIASGSGPLSYSIDGGLNFGSDSQFVVNDSRDYEVRVRDRDGCTRFERITVPPFVGLELSSAENITTCEDSMGSIKLTSTSLNGNVRYALTGREYQNNPTFISLPPGEYVAYATDASGCMDSISAIRINEKLRVQETEIINTTCDLPNGSIRLFGSGGSPPYAYALGDQPFSIFDVTSDLPAGNYSTMVRDAKGCVVAGPSANVLPSSSLQLEELITSPVGCNNEGGTVQLRLPVNESTVTAFINDTIVSSFSSIRGLGAGDYNARLVNETGCVLDTTFSIITSDCQVYLPTAFSPNGDGVNDRFRPFPESGVVARITRFAIFDRWGEEVYKESNLSTGNIDFGWDGSIDNQLAHPGVYVYQLSILFTNGFTTDRKGSFHLIR